MKRHAKPGIAVVGAGLAGLTAAYYLRDRFRVTILERENRVGGRVLTSRLPYGEHGAQFVYPGDTELRRLLEQCDIPLDPVDEHCWFRLGMRYGKGSIRQAARQLLRPSSARRVARLLKRARTAGEKGRSSDAKAGPWVRTLLKHDKDAIDFIRMIIAGEICADLDHVRIREVLGALYSENCCTIRGGSQRLVGALRKRCGTTIVFRAQVTSIRDMGAHVVITWTKRGKRETRQFAAAIVTSPDGQPLRSRRSRHPSHYHAYISVLLAYRDSWWCAHLQDALRDGLYTDGPINFVQQVKHGRDATNTLRILLPDAGSKLSWSKARIVKHCVEELRKLSPVAGYPSSWDVQKWQFGLPCRGRDVSPNPTGRIVLAGDRFGEWPSMNAATSSGNGAARAVRKLWPSGRTNESAGGL